MGLPQGVGERRAAAAGGARETARLNSSAPEAARGRAVQCRRQPRPALQRRRWPEGRTTSYGNLRWPRAERACERSVVAAAAGRSSGHRERSEDSSIVLVGAVSMFSGGGLLSAAQQALCRLRISAHWPPPGKPAAQRRAGSSADPPLARHRARQRPPPRFSAGEGPRRDRPAPRRGPGRNPARGRRREADSVAYRVGVQVRVHGRPFGSVRARRVFRAGDVAAEAASTKRLPALRSPARRRKTREPVPAGRYCCAASTLARRMSALRARRQRSVRRLTPLRPRSHFHHWLVGASAIFRR